MEKVRCSMWCPIRDKASSLDGRVNVLGVKVKRVRAKRIAVVGLRHSEIVRRKAQSEDVSRCERSSERKLSSRQRRMKTGLVLAITFACRPRGCSGVDGDVANQSRQWIDD